MSTNNHRSSWKSTINTPHHGGQSLCHCPRPECSKPGLYCFGAEATLSPGSGSFFSPTTQFPITRRPRCVGRSFENRRQKGIPSGIHRPDKLQKLLVTIDQKPYLKFRIYFVRIAPNGLPQECFFDCLGFQPVDLDRRPNQGYQGMANLFCLHTMTLGTESLRAVTPLFQLRYVLRRRLLPGESGTA
jgi:hypothetical protein